VLAEVIERRSTIARMGGRLVRRSWPIAVCVMLLAVGCSDDDPAPPADRAADTEAPADRLEITTELGVVRGTESGVDGVRAFLNIPYAAPPTGDARWRPPQPRDP